MKNRQQGAVREAVGVFKTFEDFQGAIDELLSAGFHRSELSLLASEQAIEKTLGQGSDQLAARADDENVPRSAYVSMEAIGDAQGGLISALTYVGATVAAGAVIASGGTVAAAVVAAAATGGTGGVVGSIMAKWLGDHQATVLQEHINSGGLLLWVRTWDAADEIRALEILKKHSALDAHVHGLPIAA